MASRRNLKKDIDYLTYEVVSDCYTYMFLHNDKNNEEVVKIIEDTLNSRNDLINRVNHPEGKGDKKQTKAHFRKVFEDLIKNVDSSFDRLSKLSK